MFYVSTAIFWPSVLAQDETTETGVYVRYMGVVDICCPIVLMYRNSSHSLCKEHKDNKNINISIRNSHV